VSKEKCYTSQACNASTPPDEKYKENEPRNTDHAFYAVFPRTSPTKQLLRKKNLKKNLYRPGILGELGIMSNTNGYLLPVVPVVPVQKLSN
jgi:hypothetical protein